MSNVDTMNEMGFPSHWDEMVAIRDGVFAAERPPRTYLLEVLQSCDAPADACHLARFVTKERRSERFVVVAQNTLKAMLMTTKVPM